MNFKIDFICKITHDKPIVIPFHKHTYYELVYYSVGKGLVNVDGNDFNYSAGDVIIVNPNVSHNEENFYKSVNIVVGFHTNDDSKIPLGKLSIDNTTKLLLENMANEMLEQASNYEEILEKQFELLFLYLNRNSSTQSPKNFDKLFTNIDNFIEENLNSPITLETLANSYNYSVSNFRHLFTQNVKLSPKQYIIQKRINKAQYFLEKTKKNITEIAYECGFYDTAQFSRLFKKRFNLSPLQYRNTYIDLKK